MRTIVTAPVFVKKLKRRHSSDGDDHGDVANSPAIRHPGSVSAITSVDRNSDNNMNSFVGPWSGTVFGIRCVSSRKVITLLYGELVLRAPSLFGSSHWFCLEKDGWLGFRNLSSGDFLGDDDDGYLCCVAKFQCSNERFCARMTPDKGCALFMPHEQELCHVGLRDGENLAMNCDGETEKIIWEFVPIH